MVLTRLDYGSATLSGLPNVLLDRLQSVLHAAARLIYSARKYDHVTQLLCDFHWLRVPERIVPPGSARCSLPAWYCTTVGLPVCRAAHSCGRHRFLTATSIIKRGGAFHSANEAIDDWWSCVFSRGGTSLEQFATFISSSPSLPEFKHRLKTELFTRLYPAAEYSEQT